MKQEYILAGRSLHLNEELCIGCGKCVEVCPHDVFAIKEKKAVIQKQKNCMECGACAMNCPKNAISVKSGVGCAYAIINGMLSGKEACCGSNEGCDTKSNNCC